MKAVWEVQYRPLAEPQAQEAEDPRARGQAQKWIGKFWGNQRKIQKHECILPDKIVTRELYWKKIDQEILEKLTEL